MSLKKSIVIISLGLINTLHASLHIIQFIQSLLLLKSVGSEPHSFLEHPVFVMVWALVGLITLVVGVRDFIHHKKCNH